jgi:hypothetical protein
VRRQSGINLAAKEHRLGAPNHAAMRLISSTVHEREFRLTRALAEANRASFAIKSAKDAGTLVEVTFPGARVAAE